jgi:hypothetical protein
MNLTEEEIFTIASDLGGPAYVTTIIEELLNREIIRQVSASNYDIEYAVRPSAFVYVERLLEDPDLNFSQTLNRVPDTDTPDSGHKSDDVWRPLPIDREAPEYSEAVESIGEAVQIVEQDNGYPTSDPEERNQIVDSLKTGLQWIKEGAPSLAQIRATVVAPLKFLASKFSGAAMGEAAKVAVAKITA